MLFLKIILFWHAIIVKLSLLNFVDDLLRQPEPILGFDNRS